MEQMWLKRFKDENLSIDDIERSVRYAQDLTKGLATIKTYPQGVTVFGSARLKADSEYYKKAYELGMKLAQNKHAVITGGGNGIMEAANRGAFDAGGRSIGLNIKLPHEQTLNPYTTDNLEFNYFFARKVMLTFSAEAYVYFPGGFGTIDELSEILTLIQTHKVPPAPILLYGSSFWQPLDAFFRTEMEEKEKTISVGDRAIYTITDDIDYIVKVANETDTDDTETKMQKITDETSDDYKGRVL
jgi:uncharacterized protein (TIGR00730 family)